MVVTIDGLGFQELLKIVYTDPELSNILDIEYNPGEIHLPFIK